MTWIVKCPSCKKESEIHAISRLSLIVDDGTGSIQTTISSPDVDKFIPFTGIQLKQAEENGIDVYEEIADSISQVTIVAFVRSYEVTYHRESEMKVNIVTAYKHGDPHNSQPTDQTTDKHQPPPRDKINILPLLRKKSLNKLSLKAQTRRRKNPTLEDTCSHDLVPYISTNITF